MSYGLRRVAAPAEEPVTLAEAKAHCRVDADLTIDDPYLTSLIVTAREYCEGYTGRAFITQTWQLSLNEWPADDVIYVPKAPLISVPSITYPLEADGTVTTLDPDEYEVDTASEPGRITASYDGSGWPSFREQLNAIKITFTCGYGNAAAVPQGIKNAMLLLVGHWYRVREEVQPGQWGEIPMGADTLLWSFKTGALEV